MAMQTTHLVQAYVTGRGGALRAEPQVVCPSAEDARRKADRLSAIRVGVVAYSVSADAELGVYDEAPTILFKAGRLPPPFDEL